MGLVAPQCVESSWTRDQTCVLCIGRSTLNHRTTREVHPLLWSWLSSWSLCSFSFLPQTLQSPSSSHSHTGFLPPWAPSQSWFVPWPVFWDPLPPGLPKARMRWEWSPRSPCAPGLMLFRVWDILGIISYYSLLLSFLPPSHPFFFCCAWPRIDPWPPALGVQGLNPWTTRDIPFLFLSFFSPLPTGLWDLSSLSKDWTWALGSKSPES